MKRIPIIQGEHCVSGDPGVIISTLLGSCVAVCLQDPEGRLGGMNHFLLGEPNKTDLIRDSDRQRYGVHAMELLINALMRKGAIRSRLRAHLYGGGEHHRRPWARSAAATPLSRDASWKLKA